jgi:hypothetical protein
MDASTKDKRTLWVKGLNFGGTTDWAVAFEHDMDDDDDDFIMRQTKIATRTTKIAILLWLTSITCRVFVLRNTRLRPWLV